MFRNKLLRTTAVALGLAGMLSNTTFGIAQATGTGSPSLTTAQKIALLRANVKYVFVIFAEDRSFDHYFGTFPGANGLLAAPAGFTPANQMPSFNQRLLNTSLQTMTVSPSLIPNGVTALTTGTKNIAGSVVNIYPADTASVSHSHQGIANSMDYDASTGVSLNDRYAMTQQSLTTTSPGGPLVTTAGVAPASVSLASMQQAMLDIGHVDCDTVPFLWQWASNFVLYDNFHQSTVGPSAPNAISLLAGQTGETQVAPHPGEAPAIGTSATGQPLGQSYSGPSGNTNGYVPNIAIARPFPGSTKDTNTVKPPYNSDESATNHELNLTFASLPLSFVGSNIVEIIASDPNPRADLLDVQHDIFIVASFNAEVPPGWFQQGFDANDAEIPAGYPDAQTPAVYSSYVLHYNGPQFFGYLADNPAVLNSNLHGAAGFFTAVNGKLLPASGGVFYLRGGYGNNDGLIPADPTTAVKQAFVGNDDHPGYSDAQITEALAAEAINAIVNSGYWNNAVIIITYDETDGLHDHVSPTIRNTTPDGTPLQGGPRIPGIVISPFAATGTISHSHAEPGSIIKFIDEVFNQVPLASLPDEAHGGALAAASAALGNPANYGPSDDPANALGDLADAFDYTILAGTRAPLSSALATFTPAQVASLPHLATTPNGLTNGACRAINGGAGVLPTDYASWVAYTAGTPSDPPPSTFNPRPSASPGTPTNGSWRP